VAAGSGPGQRQRRHSRITVRQLPQYTSGIPDVGPEIPALDSADGYRAERFRTYTPKELVGLGMQHAPNFSPGAGWSYSNTNYMLAAMITQKVTGRSWAQEVNDGIIRPLGLRDTSRPGVFRPSRARTPMATRRSVPAPASTSRCSIRIWPSAPDRSSAPRTT
jgi:CubicO group peptidase (beta-lactamase class C family)